jgi:hypothetical protein
MAMTFDPRLAENLRRWQQSGGPLRWVEWRRGQWGHAEWLALLDALRASDLWPLDPEAVGAALEESKRRYWSCRRWRDSGGPRRWVEARQGQWDHGDWTALLEELGRSGYGPLDPGQVGQALEEARVRRNNLGRWRAAGGPRRWVEGRQGEWGHADWLDLLGQLRGSDFWPLDEDEVGLALEEARTHYENLRSWLESGRARQWVEARRGQWDHVAWLALHRSLEEAGLWPMDPEALGQALGRLKGQWWGLHRWRGSGLARQWVVERQGRWTHEDWLGLLAALRASDFWPLDPEALGRTLEEVKAEWLNFRRWQRAGEPRRWRQAHPEGWTPAEGRALLERLRQSPFWPLDADAVRQALQGPGPPARQAA